MLLYVPLFWWKCRILKFHQRQTLCYLAFVELSMNAWIMDMLADNDISLPWPPLCIHNLPFAHLCLVVQSFFLYLRSMIEGRGSIPVRTHNSHFTTECVIQETYNHNNSSNNSTIGNLRYMIFSCGIPKTLITIVIFRAMWPSSCWKCSVICICSF